MAKITLNEMYQKLGLGGKGLKNPIRLTRFMRPYGGIIRASLTDKQAAMILTPDGLLKWEHGEVLNSGDVNDSTVMKAVMGEQGIVNQNPLFHGAGKDATNKNAIVCGTVILAGLVALEHYQHRNDV